MSIQDSLILDQELLKELWHKYDNEELPYLKHIEVVKLTPRHFGLDRWRRMFVIPDAIMRKIYRHDAWKDTDCAEANDRRDKLTPIQRETLSKWLKLDSPFRYESDDELTEERQVRSRACEDDDLFSLLSKFDDLSDPNADICDKQKKGTIETCLGHKIQPENKIVTKALKKFEQLSDEEERHFRNLIGDKEFMDFLNDTVKRYLDNCDQREIL